MKKLLILAALTGIGTVMAVVSQQPLFSHGNIHQQLPIDQEKIGHIQMIIPEDKWRYLCGELLCLDTQNMLTEENLVSLINQSCLQDKDIILTSLKNIPLIEMLKVFKNDEISNIDEKLIGVKKNKDFLKSAPLRVLALLVLLNAAWRIPRPLFGLDIFGSVREEMYYMGLSWSLVMSEVFLLFFGKYFDDNRSIRKSEDQINKIDTIIEKIKSFDDAFMQQLSAECDLWIEDAQLSNSFAVKQQIIQNMYAHLDQLSEKDSSEKLKAIYSKVDKATQELAAQYQVSVKDLKG